MVVNFFDDFPQLQEVVRDNYEPKKKYVNDAVRAFNADRNTDKEAWNRGWYYGVVDGEIVPRIDFFREHHLLKPENLYAPSDSSLNRGNMIYYKNVTYEYYERNAMAGNQYKGEKSVVSFTYGKGPIYKKGMMFSNMGKILDSRESSKLLFQKYKRRIILRASVQLVGWGLLGLSIDAFMGNKITSLSEDAAIGTAVAGVFMANFGLVYTKSRLMHKYMEPAVDAYNQEIYIENQ